MDNSLYQKIFGVSVCATALFGIVNVIKNNDFHLKSKSKKK